MSTATVCNNIIVLHSNYINVNVYLKQGSRAHFRNKFISYITREHACKYNSHRIEYEPPYYIVARLYTTVSRRSMHRVYKSIGNKKNWGTWKLRLSLIS